MSLLAVSSENLVVCRGSTIDCYDFSTHVILQVSDTAEDETITDIVISHSEKHLAVLLSKKLIIYELPHLTHIKNFLLPRSSSKIRFGVNNSEIFVADKAGDVLHFKLNESNGTKLSGHLSLLLNVLQTGDGKYIITSDRDEKIKVSCYPNTYSIQTYCLGHKEFVNHIELVPHTSGYITSGSGDGTIKVWDYINGNLLYTIDTYKNVKNNDQLKEEFSKIMDEEGIDINSLPIVDFAITKFNDSSSLIAVTVHTYRKVLVYQLSIIDKQFMHTFLQDITFNNSSTAIKFHNHSLFIYNEVDSIIEEYSVVTDSDKILIDHLKSVRVFENVTIKVMENYWDHNSIKLLFKRKFDNVQEYQERKKQRLEKPTV